MTTTYHIHAEYHVTPTVDWIQTMPPHRVKHAEPMDFHYSIRRADNSPVFRAATLNQAEEIVKRLYATTAGQAAA